MQLQEEPMSLTDGQYFRLADLAMHIEAGELRRVKLSDGRAVIVDADDPNTDEEIRAAYEAAE
jgi:hypothetical protein